MSSRTLNTKKFYSLLDDITQKSFVFEFRNSSFLSFMERNKSEIEIEVPDIRLFGGRCLKFFMNYAYEIFKGFDCNPQNKQLVDLSRLLYSTDIEVSDNMDGIANKEINGKFEIEDLILSKDIPMNMLLIGKKGAGKTSFINYFLNINNEKLEEKNITWFKVSMSKIIDMVKKDSISIYQYDLIHSLYVINKYKCFSQILKKIYLGLGERGQKVLEESFKGYKSFSSILNDVTININDLHKELRRVHDNFIEYIEDDDIKLILIIDGIDNLSWQFKERNEERLGKIYQEICNIMYSHKDTVSPIRAKYHHVIITLRPETVSQCKKYMPQGMDTREYFINRLKVIPAKLDKIIDKRKFYICKKKSDFYFTNERDMAIKYCKRYDNNSHISFDTILGDFCEYSDFFIKKLLSGIQKTYKMAEKFLPNNSLNFSSHDFKNMSDLLEIVYNSNIRFFLDNMVRSYSVYRSARILNIIGHDKDVRFPQYILLNGNPYINSSENIGRQRGEGIPNIFWWDRDWARGEQRWLGFSGYRLLQYLSSPYYQPSSIEDTIYEVSSIFQYPRKVIERQIDRFIPYGLIQVDDDKNISITKKGRFIFEFVFIYPDWLYFISLDTPLPAKLTQDMKIHDISYDIEKNSFYTSFNEAYIENTLIFTSFLKYIHKLELGDVRRSNYRDINLKDYDIPFSSYERLLINHIRGLYSMLLRRSRDKAENVFNNLDSFRRKSKIVL